MRESVLVGYRNAAKVVEKKAAKMFRHVFNFNTDELDQNEVSFKVTKLCLEKLESVAKEKIGFLPKKEIEKFDIGDVFGFSKIEKLVESHLQFDDRDKVEKNKQTVQLIPIAFIKDTDDLKFIVARKRKDNSPAGSPEDGKILLYFGGHVREEDKTLFDSPSSIEILKQCLYREVKEELGIDINGSDEEPICVWIRDGKKSEQHIAVAFFVERDLDYTKVQIDDREFVRLTKKEKYGTGSKIDATGIAENIGKIDQWSRHILKERFSQQLEYSSAQKTLWDARS
ncbi:NUDIX hydrolase [Mesorhizobium sp. M0586]|uniref:NUDIX hydrolase n=1 Tax=unclassified Mesorhizobium TaxID=325217 RepID=UPI00333A0892